MSRPNRTIIESMSKALLDHKFKDQVKRLGATNVKLFGKVYNKLYSPAVQVKMSELEQLRPKAFRMCDSIVVNASGYRVSVGGRVSINYIKPLQEVITKRPFLDDDHGYNVLNLTDPKLIEEVQAFASEVRSFNEQINTAYGELQAALSAFTTYKKLAEGWPEAMPVIGHLIPENNRTLPAVRVDELNTKFGLPPKTTKKGTK